MLTPETVQAAIISLMKSRPSLVSAVGAEIREDNYQAVSFAYPAYRVAVNSMSPLGNGECRPLMSEVRWSVYAFAEDPSSRAAAALTGLVANELFGRQLSGAGIVSMTRVNIPEGGVTPPVPEGERMWRGEVMFVAQVKEAGLP